MNSDIITSIIVEDDIEACLLLRNYLQDIPGIELISYHSNAEEALPSIIKGSPDIIFLDVELPKKSGMELLEDIQKVSINPCIIFTTAHNHYAVKAIKFAAFDYLLKPIDKDELLITITRFKMIRQHYNFEKKINLLFSHLDVTKKIKFNTQNGIIVVNLDDIIYCKADWNYTTLYLVKDRIETVTMNIGKLQESLPEQIFIKISRSLMINVNYIDKINKRMRKCYLLADNKKYELSIPVFNIKRIDSALNKLL